MPIHTTYRMGFRIIDGDTMILLYISTLDTDDERIKMTQIYERYKSLMLMYARKILKNEEQAENAVHEAFLSIIKHKEKYLSNSCPDLGVPIVIITRNKCFDMLKRANYNEENIDEHEHYLEADIVSMDNKLIQNDEYELLRKHLTVLDDLSISILEMRYVLGMSHKEISKVTNLSLDNINKRITRAKSKVRKSYEDRGDQ
ncbi:MAG: sigma-70 family RNA polymerase sigma factor [Oscillospiraceae bacterium]|jgi:RNA polymerase sigma-70 factor (ECF subfamily)|nr:sigma-70 family RNA polymerase sigma factor [Oscillospiraceae bacterium]